MSNTDPSAYISFGSRIRKSPFYNSTRKYGAKGFTIYNHMYMPTVYTSDGARAGMYVSVLSNPV